MVETRVQQFQTVTQADNPATNLNPAEIFSHIFFLQQIT